MFKVSEENMSPASEIFAIRSSHWHQRPGRKGGQKRALGITSEIYLLERVLQVGFVIVTSEL